MSGTLYRSPPRQPSPPPRAPAPAANGESAALLLPPSPHQLQATLRVQEGRVPTAPMASSPPFNVRSAVRALRLVLQHAAAPRTAGPGSRPATRPDLALFATAAVAATLPAVIAVYTLAGYRLVLAPGALYAALVAGDQRAFGTATRGYAVLAAAVLALRVLRAALREAGAVLLRDRLARSVHSIYVAEAPHPFRRPPYYALADGKAIDNPDQRVAADVRDFAVSFFDMCAGEKDSGGLIEAAGSILWYSLKTAERTGWIGIASAYFWSLLVMFVTVRVVNRTAPWLFRQEELEARLRFSHSALRRHAEQIAFLRGAPCERLKLDALLADAVTNSWAVLYRHVFLNLVQYGFGYFVSLVMYGTIGIAIFGNFMSSSAASFTSDMSSADKAKWISQTAGVFIQLLFSFTTVIQLGTMTTTFMANTMRVAQLLEALVEHRQNISASHSHSFENSELRQGVQEGLESYRQVNTNSTPPHSGDGRHRPHRAATADSHDAMLAWPPCVVQTDRLTIHVNDSTSVGPVSMLVEPGKRVLVEGPSGTGKSCIMRVLRGLWTPSGGSVYVPPHAEDVLFVPQVPYIGDHQTLREVVLYPSRPSLESGETRLVLAVLRRVGWRRGNTRQLLDESDVPWTDHLSPGEAQMIAAARVLIQKPRFAIMDEPTSSLDESTEEMIFASFREAGIGILTAGHGNSLRQYHDTSMTIGSDSDRRS
jgi:ABC-type uncharacterized transport system fused permease/ATPase subunit